MPESNIRYIDLEENVGGGRGAHTSGKLHPFFQYPVPSLLLAVTLNTCHINHIQRINFTK